MFQTTAPMASPIGKYWNPPPSNSQSGCGPFSKVIFLVSLFPFFWVFRELFCYWTDREMDSWNTNNPAEKVKRTEGADHCCLRNHWRDIRCARFEKSSVLGGGKLRRPKCCTVTIVILVGNKKQMNSGHFKKSTNQSNFPVYFHYK